MATGRAARAWAAAVLVLVTAACAPGVDEPAADIEETSDGIRVSFPVGVTSSALPGAQPGGKATRQSDGSVLVTDAEDRLVVAYLPPTPEGLVELRTRGRAAQARVVAEEPTAPVSVDIQTRDELIERVRWVTRNDGLISLEVIPNQTGRRWSSTSAMDAGWRAVVDAVPDADTPGMKEQYMCHAQFAPRKDGWYLEPWRPAGSYLEVLAARCNRGPQTDPD